jgi:cell division protein ZapB
LTAKNFSNRLSIMEERLDTLDSKVAQVLALCQSLRSENHALRNRVAGLEGENRQLVDKIVAARERLESLITGLPES